MTPSLSLLEKSCERKSREKDLRDLHRFDISHKLLPTVGVASEQ